jgi:hypothetical protein
MKDVRITLDEVLLRDARRIAAERSTTLNALIRDYLAADHARVAYNARATAHRRNLRGVDRRGRPAELDSRLYLEKTCPYASSPRRPTHCFPLSRAEMHSTCSKTISSVFGSYHHLLMLSPLD